jgi:hypothetical protein
MTRDESFQMPEKKEEVTPRVIMSMEILESEAFPMSPMIVAREQYKYRDPRTVMINYITIREEFSCP